MEIVLGIFGGALLSWLITYIYYRQATAKERDKIKKEVMLSKLSDYQRALSKMGDTYLRAILTQEEDLEKFVEANAEEILNLLEHNQGFVREMLKEHRDELDFSSIERLDSTMYSLFWKYW